MIFPLSISHFSIHYLSILYFLVFFEISVAAQGQNCEGYFQERKLNTDIINRNDLINCAFQLQNSGFILDEQECDFDSARTQIEKALSLWIYLEDTLSQANLLKFLGYLNGRLEKFSLGKKQINQAIQMYEMKGAEFGVSVSHFNLARIYEYENKIDSAIYYTSKSKSYWSAQNENHRVFGLNNNLLHLYSIKKENHLYAKLIEQNNSFLQSDNIYWLNELDFYFVASKVFEKLNLEKEHQDYSLLYKLRTDSLLKEGITNAYSMYDPQRCRLK